MIRRRLSGLLILVWALSIVISHFIVQQVQYNPLGKQGIIALGYLARDMAAVPALLVLAGALGTIFLRGIAGLLTELEQSGLAVLLGLGVLGVIVLVIGLLGFFPPMWLGWLVMASLLTVLYDAGLIWLRRTWKALQIVFEPEPDVFVRWVRNGVVILLILALLLAMAPPTKWDALTYHLAGPHFYLQTERIVSCPQNHFLGFPLGVEMLYLWLMILARPQAAALLHWCFGASMLMLVLGFSRRMGRPAAGWIAATVLLVSASIWREFSWPYNDLALMSYTMAALTVVLIWDRNIKQHRHSQRLLVLAGIFVGLALSTKYTAAGVAVGVGVLVLWLSRRCGLLYSVRAGGVLTAAALLVFLPWLVKNLLLDGNPFSPFLWGTTAFDHLDRWYYLRSGTGLGGLRLLLFPLEGTIRGNDSIAPYGASSGVLALCLLPVAALGWKQRTETDRYIIRNLLIFSLPPYLIWLAGVATSWFLVQIRLLFPIFPAVGLVCGFGLAGLGDTTIRSDVSRLLRPLVLIVLVMAVFNSFFEFVQIDPLRVAFGMQSEEDYLDQTMGVSYEAMKKVNALPQDAKVLFLWEPRIFYCQRDCIPDSLINRWWHDRQLEPDPHRIIAQWREEGVTHVLIADWGMNFLINEESELGSLSEEDVVALGKARKADMSLLWNESGLYSLYELKDVRP
ncbi:MAG: phospholipid carrier-dependent glycosyltransferase [Anaerolineae bacterium]|nr:phospholipid carrier-dependent glycosyltransferase [Anaerolineae bacterium]